MRGTMPDWRRVLLEATMILRGGSAGRTFSAQGGSESARGGASLEDWLQLGFMDVLRQARLPRTHEAAVEAVVRAAKRRRDSDRRQDNRCSAYHDDLKYRSPGPEEQSSAQDSRIVARDFANRLYHSVKDDVLAGRILEQILRFGMLWHDTQGLADALDVECRQIKLKKDFIIRRALKLAPEMRKRRKPGGSNG